MVNNHWSVNPVVALNSAFGFIKPLTIEHRGTAVKTTQSTGTPK